MSQPRSPGLPAGGAGSDQDPKSSCAPHSRRPRTELKEPSACLLGGGGGRQNYGIFPKMALCLQFLATGPEGFSRGHTLIFPSQLVLVSRRSPLAAPSEDMTAALLA